LSCLLSDGILGKVCAGEAHVAFDGLPQGVQTPEAHLVPQAAAEFHADGFSVQNAAVIENMGLAVHVAVPGNAGTHSYVGDTGVAPVTHMADAGIDAASGTDVSLGKILIDGGQTDGPSKRFSVEYGKTNRKIPSQKDPGGIHISLCYGAADPGRRYDRRSAHDGRDHCQRHAGIGQIFSQLIRISGTAVSEAEVEAAHSGGAPQLPEQVVGDERPGSHMPHSVEILKDGVPDAGGGKLPQLFLPVGQTRDGRVFLYEGMKGPYGGRAVSRLPCRFHGSRKEPAVSCVHTVEISERRRKGALGEGRLRHFGKFIYGHICRGRALHVQKIAHQCDHQLVAVDAADEAAGVFVVGDVGRILGKYVSDDLMEGVVSLVCLIECLVYGRQDHLQFPILFVPDRECQRFFVIVFRHGIYR